MIQFQENSQRDRRTEEHKDRQTLFHETLLATAASPVKGYNICNYHCKPSKCW